MSKEAMKLALEALVKSVDNFPANRKHRHAIWQVREALTEQPAQQEPVAWICEGSSSDEKHAIDYWPGDIKDIPIGTKLYTSPPAQRKPLTDMQVDGEWILVRDLDTNDVEKSRLFARAIEAAHGIKENT